MKRTIKRIAFGLLGVVVAAALVLGIYVFVQVSAFDESAEKVYDVPLLKVERSSDPEVLERGHHLAEAVVPCLECHGSDLGGGKTIEIGPLGTFTPPNITAAGIGAAYSDAEMARLVRHGVKKDGRTALFMPSHEFNWLSDEDLTAVISFVRTQPAVDKPNGPMRVGVLGKVLDRRGMIPLDVARKIDHDHIELAPAPTPTAEYGRFLGRLCMGCHGEHFSGGPIPGAPSSLPIPRNLTPHETGLKGWTFEDFDTLLTKGLRKNGQKLDPFMPIKAIGKMNDTEKKALFAFLQTLPPRPFGER